MNAVSAADHGGVFEFPRAVFQNFRQLLQIVSDHLRCLADEQSLGSVDDVIGSQAVVKPAGVRPNNFRHRSSEGDDIMPHRGFDFLNALRLKVGAFANRLGRRLGHNAGFGERFSGRYFDCQPGAKAIFVAPDSAQLGSRVAWDQRSCSFNFVD